MLEVIKGRQIRIEMGKIPDQFVALPKFLIRLGLPLQSENKPFICIGRLYRGYIGAYIITPLFIFSMLVYYPDKELKKERDKIQNKKIHESSEKYLIKFEKGA